MEQVDEAERGVGQPLDAAGDPTQARGDVLAADVAGRFAAASNLYNSLSSPFVFFSPRNFA